MTKSREGVSRRNRLEGSQVSKARPGAPFDFTLRYCRGHKLCHPERTRIFYFTALTGATYVVLLKENHMQLLGAAALDRKSRGEPTCPGVPWRDLQFRGPFLDMFLDRAQRVERSAVSLAHTVLRPVFRDPFPPSAARARTWNGSPYQKHRSAGLFSSIFLVDSVHIFPFDHLMLKRIVMGALERTCSAYPGRSCPRACRI